MADGQPMLQYALKIIFWGIIPAALIYFRLIKKIRTGFTLGVICLSAASGLIAMATVQRIAVGDPATVFIRELNSGSYENALRSYKILIQYGPDFLQRVKSEHIQDEAFFQRVREGADEEYRSIAERICNECAAGKYQPEEASDKLRHALKLLAMSESVGISHMELKEKLEAMLKQYE